MATTVDNVPQGKADPYFSDVPSKVHGDQANWYHGTMKREDTESILQRVGKVGSFLIRRSPNKPGENFVLSILLENRIAHSDGVSISSNGMWICGQKQMHILDIISDLGIEGNPIIANTDDTSIPETCPYWMVCKEYKDSLNIDDAYFDPRYDLCYCVKCHDKRGDKDVYTRGDPPMKYALPIGWCRFSLKVPPKATAQDVFKKWHVGFHGTDSTAVESIFSCGDLLMPGDYAVGGRRMSEKEGHFDDDRKPEGFNTKQIFLSPSIKYAGCDVYAKPVTFKTSTGKAYEARVAFQVSICPGSYEIGPETVGSTEKNIQIDPHFDNDEMEWSTKERGSTILYGLLINMEET